MGTIKVAANVIIISGFLWFQCFDAVHNKLVILGDRICCCKRDLW